MIISRLKSMRTWCICIVFNVIVRLYTMSICVILITLFFVLFCVSSEPVIPFHVTFARHAYGQQAMATSLSPLPTKAAFLLRRTALVSTSTSHLPRHSSSPLHKESLPEHLAFPPILSHKALALARSLYSSNRSHTVGYRQPT